MLRKSLQALPQRLLATAMAACCIGATPVAQPTTYGPLQVVESIGGDHFRPVGLGVSHTGRIFVTAPSGSARGGWDLAEFDPATRALKPYPDLAWNTFRPHADGRAQWLSVQALWVDKADHLWALDTSRADVDQRRLPPKLVEFDLQTNRAIRAYTFDGVVTPKDALNDVRIDLVHGYAYLTNALNRGGLLIVNLKTGKSRLVLAGTKSAVVEPGQHFMVDGKIAKKLDGDEFVVQTDGIALSTDARWLYYRPLTDHNYWRIPTAALINASLSEAALQRQVQYLGRSVMSGGMIMDSRGRLYGGDLEHHSISMMTLQPNQRGLVTRTLVHDPVHLSWADSFAIHDGWLYVADSHLMEVAFSNGPKRSGPFNVYRLRLPS